MNSQRNDPPIVEIAAAKVNNLPALHALLTYCELPTAGVDAHFDTMLVAREGQHLVGSVSTLRINFIPNGGTTSFHVYTNVFISAQKALLKPRVEALPRGRGETPHLEWEVSELRTQHREVHEKWGDVLNMEPFWGKSRGFSHLL